MHEIKTLWSTDGSSSFEANRQTLLTVAIVFGTGIITVAIVFGTGKSCSSNIASSSSNSASNTSR